jgi:hypothetical protein
MSDFIASIPVLVEYRVERPELTGERRRDLEHRRRMAIMEIRYCDEELYGRNDHTIPARRR